MNELIHWLYLANCVLWGIIGIVAACVALAWGVLFLLVGNEKRKLLVIIRKKEEAAWVGKKSQKTTSNVN